MVAREPIRFDIERREGGKDSGASLDYYHPSTNSCPSDNSDQIKRSILACVSRLHVFTRLPVFKIILNRLLSSLTLTRTYLIDPFQKFQTSDR